MGAVSAAIAQMFAEFGTPEATLSDNGKEFRNRMLSDLLLREEVEERHSMPYRSCTNGNTERANRTITDLVR